MDKVSDCCGADVEVELAYLYVDKKPNVYYCSKCNEPCQPKEREDEN